MEQTHPTTAAQPAAENVNEDRLGLIYSPKPGKGKRWKHILRYLEQRGVVFDYVKSENSANVERLAAMMTRSGYRTIIIAGGDAALNYAINGIMKTPSPQGGHPTLGVIPMGFANDFARFWGFSASDYRRTINCLLAHRTRRIDVGCVVPETADASTQTPLYFLNCVNIGVAAAIVNLRHWTRSFLGLRTLSYLLSAFLLIFQRMSFNLEFSTGGDHFKRRAMTLCIGSARGYGQTPSAVPYNGQLDVSLVTPPQFTQMLHGLWLLLTGRFLSHKGISVWRSNRIEIQKLDHAGFSLDGRFCPLHATGLHVSIRPEEIAFLIP